MPGRQFNLGSGYRFGFNGMELDNEVSGQGNAYTTMYRGYDPRIIRWRSLDPITHEWQSPYSSFNNNPVFFMDPSGASGETAKTERGIVWSGDVINSNGEYDIVKEKTHQDMVDEGLTPIFTRIDSKYKGRAFNFHNSSDKLPGYGEQHSYSEANVTARRIIVKGGNESKYEIEDAGFYLSMAGSAATSINAHFKSFEDLLNAKSAPAIYNYVRTYSQASSTSSEVGIWLGKNGKWYSEFWGGNQWTGSRSGAPTIKSIKVTTIKTAKDVLSNVEWDIASATGKYSTFTNVVGKVGVAFGGLNQISLFTQYRNNNLTHEEMFFETLVNGYSTFGGLKGAAVGVGWEMGRNVSNRTDYKMWKYNKWLPFRKRMLNY